ncbi:MAG: DMT family transporter [Hyphomicrobiales bacterium]
MDEARSRLIGIALMVGSFVVFAAVDASAKYLSASLPVGQVIFLRYIIATIYAAIILSATGGLRFFKTKKPGLQVVRGILLAIATVTNFIALQHLRLDQTSSIMFSSPLWVCALSVPLLGESVGPRRWAAVAGGFIGVLIIVRPGTEGFHWAMLVSLISPLAVALYLIASRKVGETDSAQTSMFYPTLVGTFAVLPMVPLEWAPPSGYEWFIAVIMGVSASVGHQMLSQAHRMAPAPILAPFIYTQIISMAAMGYIFFGDVPDRWTFAGAAIVIASGLYLLARERQLKA